MLEQAKSDFLTGFFSRDSLDEFLQKVVADAKVGNDTLSVALIDLDRFKKFNDKFGHFFGDEILKYAASTLRLTLYGSRTYLFRYGGDEFIGVFLDREPAEILHLFQKCNYNLRHRPFLFKNKFYRITISCGIAAFPSDAESAKELVGKADKAMYYSKRHGRNLITMASKLTYLRLREVLIFIAGACIMIWIAFMITSPDRLKKYNFEFISNQIHYFKAIGMKSKTEPAPALQRSETKVEKAKTLERPDNEKRPELDTIILKNGSAYEGRILKETVREVVLDLNLKKGTGILSFSRSKISKIKYGKTADQISQ